MTDHPSSQAQAKVALPPPSVLADFGPNRKVYGFTADHMNAHGLACYEAGLRASQSAGMVLETREPTEAMIEAGKDERMECLKDFNLSVGAALSRIYRAMIAASPTTVASEAPAVAQDRAARAQAEPVAAARKFVYDEHVRPLRSGDDESLPGLSWYDFGSSRMHPCVINARGRTALRDGDWIVRIGTQYHAFSPEVYALLTAPTIPQATPPVQGDQPTPAGYVLVPREVLQAASESLGSFVSDHGWAQRDMDVMDAVDAALAAAPQVAHPQPLAASEAKDTPQ